MAIPGRSPVPVRRLKRPPSGGVVSAVARSRCINSPLAEDNCHRRTRLKLLEGDCRRRPVILAGAYIGQSTCIYDRETGEPLRRVPQACGCSGNLPSKDEEAHCAKTLRVDETAAKLANEPLRTTKSMYMGSTTLPDCLLRITSYFIFLLNTFSSCFGRL